MSEHRSCVKVVVAVLGSLSLTVLLAPVVMKQHLQKDQKKKKKACRLKCFHIFYGFLLLLLLFWRPT